MNTLTLEFRIEFWSYFGIKSLSNHWNHFKICPKGIFYSDGSSQSPIFSSVKIDCLFGKSILSQPHSSANSVGVKCFSSCQFPEIKRRTYALSLKIWLTLHLKLQPTNLNRILEHDTTLTSSENVQDKHKLICPDCSSDNKTWNGLFVNLFNLLKIAVTSWT